jgi:excisionase family DNA binding protein
MPEIEIADDALADSPIGAARRLGIGRSQFYKEVAAGRIRVRKLGKRTLVERSEQDRWLAALPHLEPSQAD